MIKKLKYIHIVIILSVLFVTSCSVSIKSTDEGIYTGQVYAIVNNNIPEFEEEDFSTLSRISFSELDEFGRCGVAFACLGSELMPTEERESIGMIKPSGWQTIRYDDLIEDKYLYNRCHLIGYQLCGENANVNNLITGTRFFNVEGMLPFENEVANYIRKTNNHVLYRVTPVFKDTNLLVSGVRMEAYSVEDQGKGVCFNVFVYNVQPNIVINYVNGDSWREE